MSITVEDLLKEYRNKLKERMRPLVNLPITAITKTEYDILSANKSVLRGQFKSWPVSTYAEISKRIPNQFSNFKQEPATIIPSGSYELGEVESLMRNLANNVELSNASLVYLCDEEVIFKMSFEHLKSTLGLFCFTHPQEFSSAVVLDGRWRWAFFFDVKGHWKFTGK